MESSPQAPKFDADKGRAPRGRNGNGGTNDARDPSSQRMVADRLMAALASGNLEHLAQARQAFLNEGPQPNQSPGEVEPQLERSSSARAFEPAAVAGNDLRAEEEALKQAELELERRRAEVQAAKKKAELEAHRKTAEEAHRRAQEESHHREVAEQQHLAELVAIRMKAEAAAQERAHKLEQLTAEIDALRASEQAELRHIEEVDANLRAQQESCKHVEAEAKRRAERAQWLTSEIEAQRTAEQEQLKLVGEIEARLLNQLEARHLAEIQARRQAEK